MPKMKTVGDLRQFLCDAIEDVADGTMDINSAREVTKLAGQVNESFYSEVKVARLQIDLSKTVASTGKLKLS